MAGRVSINNILVGNTNTAFNFTFRTRQIGVGDEIEIMYPFGSVTAPGYESTLIDFGFPDI